MSRRTSSPTRHLTPFGVLVRDLRTTRAISQATLARRCGISAGYVGLIETGDRGERPSLEIVRRFAQALECDIQQTEALLRAAGHLGLHEELIPHNQPTVQSVIEADKRLTREQKRVLIAVYQSYIGPLTVLALALICMLSAT